MLQLTTRIATNGVIGPSRRTRCRSGSTALQHIASIHNAAIEHRAPEQSVFDPQQQQQQQQRLSVSSVRTTNRGGRFNYEGCDVMGAERSSGDVGGGAGGVVRELHPTFRRSVGCQSSWMVSWSVEGGRRGKSTAATMRQEDDEADMVPLASRSTRSAAAAQGKGSTPPVAGGGTLRSFLLTDIGEGIMEVEILQWFVRPGDRVRQFDKLCEVQSDKANVEITSRYDGIVRKIHHRVGEMAKTGCVLVDIEEPPTSASMSQSCNSSLSSAEDTSLSAATSAKTTITNSSYGGVPVEEGEEGNTSGRTQVLATPAVRRLCRELKLDVASLHPGTGAGGRILKGDVLAYAAANNFLVPSRLIGRIGNDTVAGGGGVWGGGGVLSASAEGGRARGIGNDENLSLSAGGSLNGRALTPEDSGMSNSRGVSSSDEGLLRWSNGNVDGGTGFSSPVGPTVVLGVEEDGDGVVARRAGAGRRERKSSVAFPIKGVQRAMMEAMRKALEVPHMTFCDEIIADRLSLLRSDLREASERRGIKLSYLPLIVKATSMALAAYPALNASLSECNSQLLQHPDHNIGVAMDTDKGLLVPNISAAQERTILEIAEELNTLQRLGAAGKLGEAELTGTTFTLSNIGSIGGTYASPVILHPQVCIGALGRMQRVPRFDPQDPNNVVGVSVIPVSWSADHRVIDGGTLARFSNLWKAYLENPARMLADTR